MATSSVLSDNGGIVRLPLISLPTGSDYHIGFVESLVAQQSLNCMHRWLPLVYMALREGGFIATDGRCP
jgi:hypothetical protein